eukprot:1978139-Prymnesium_polylepis.1
MVADAAAEVDVLIAGGGPCGLATAIGLARAGLSVTVLERRPSSSEFESQRAYLYLLDRRGQRFTNEYGLTDAIRERGVSNDGYTITRAWPDSRGAITSEPLLAQEATKEAIWIPRAALLDVLAEAARDAGATLRYAHSLDALSEGQGRERVLATVSAVGAGAAGGGAAEIIAPRLVCACDGASSRVRSSLAQWSGDAAGGGFEPVKLQSPSSGL